MTPNWLRPLGGVVLGSVLCSSLAGCQYAYPFDVSGSVRSATTGKPLAGVQIFSVHVSPPSNSRDLPPGEDKPVAVTAEDGTFCFSARVPDVYFMDREGTRWGLIFSKGGLKEEAVDLRGVQRPSSPKTTGSVIAVVCMTEEDR